MIEKGARRTWPTGERGEGPAEDVVRNCLFPYPLPSQLRREELSQLPRRRCAAGLRDVRSAVASLNWMHGVRYRQAARGISSASRRKLTDLHGEVFDHLE